MANSPKLPALALSLGLISLWGQIIIIRELINSFYGNELFVSIIFAYWLFSVGWGSLWLGQKAKKIKINLALAYLALTAVFGLATILAYLGKIIFASTGGAIPNLGLAIAFSGLAIAPLGLILGVIFTLLAEEQFKQKPAAKSSWPAAAQIYILESLGFFGGALLFYFFAYRFSSLMIAWAVGGLCLALAGLATSLKTSQSLKSAALLAFLISGLLVPRLNASLLERQYQQKIVNFLNTKFGTIVVGRTGQNNYFYYNGRLAAIDNDRFSQELVVQPPLLLAPAAKDVLVIGNITKGLRQELSKFRLKNLTLLERDKDYFFLANHPKSWPPNVRLVFADPRRWLAPIKNNFDVIILNYPKPDTLAANRYFSEEFFQLAKQALRPGGLLAFVVKTTPNYTLGAQNQLLAIYYHTAKKIFPYLTLLPDNEVIFLASTRPLKTDSQTIKRHYQKLRLNNYFFTPAMIEWRLNNDRRQSLVKSLEQGPALTNTDQKPVLYWQQISFFLEKLKAKKLLKALAVIICLGLAGFIWFARPTSRGHWLVLSAAPEAFLLVLEITLIFYLAAKLGWLYTQISLIIALILLGLALGGLIGYQRLRLKPAEKLLPRVYGLIFLAFFLPWLAAQSFGFSFNYSLSFYFFALLAGGAVGAKFPVLNSLYLKNRRQLGAVYGADLIGAGLGALLAGSWLLPRLGITNTLAVLAGGALFSWLASWRLAKK